MFLGKTLDSLRAASRLPVFPLPVPASRTGENLCDGNDGNDGLFTIFDTVRAVFA